MSNYGEEELNSMNEGLLKLSLESVEIRVEVGSDYGIN